MATSPIIVDYKYVKFMIKRSRFFISIITRSRQGSLKFDENSKNIVGESGENEKKIIRTPSNLNAIIFKLKAF